MMTEPQTIAILSALKTLDPQGWVTVDDMTIGVWTAAMNREPSIPFEAARYTVAEIVSRPGQKFPTPGDFRGLVAEVVCKLPSTEEARKQIERSMKLNYPGMPAKYTPDRIVLDAVREIGGIHVFRVAQSEHETATLWRRFTAKYEDIRAERLDTIDYAAEYAALASGEGHIPALAGANGRPS